MTPYQIDAYLLRAFEGELHEIVDLGHEAILNPGSRAISFSVLMAGAGATTRVLADPDDFPIGTEVTLIAKDITGANTITITGLQGAAPTHIFTENGTAIFRVSLEDETKIWLMIDGEGAVALSDIENINTDRVLGRVSPGVGPVEEVTFLDPIQQIADDASFADIRTTLGLGTIATQNANNVAITGGSITGLQELEVDSTNHTGYPVTLNSTYTSGSNVTNFFDVGVGILRSGSGNITNFIATDVFATNTNASGTVTNAAVVSSTYINVGTTTNYYGYRVDTLQNSGTITNTYGVYVGDITSGTQTNQAYSFYASDPNARNHFAGMTTFADTVTITPAVNDAIGLRVNDSNGTARFQAGTLAADGISGSIWLGAVTPTNMNPVLVSDGSTALYINTPGSGSVLIFRFDGSVDTGIMTSTGLGLGFPFALSTFPDKLALLGAFSSYNTFTDASNYERLRTSWASNIVTIGTEAAGTGTLRGLRLGGATTSLLGFWNATPIVQPAAANQAALTNSTGGTYDGTLAAISGTGADAAINNNFTDLHTLLNEIRTALVNTGMIKGAA